MISEIVYLAYIHVTFLADLCRSGFKLAEIDLFRFYSFDIACVITILLN